MVDFSADISEPDLAYFFSIAFRIKFDGFSHFFEIILNESAVKVVNTKDEPFFLSKVFLYGSKVYFYAKCLKAHWERILI